MYIELTCDVFLKIPVIDTIKMSSKKYMTMNLIIYFLFDKFNPFSMRAQYLLDIFRISN